MTSASGASEVCLEMSMNVLIVDPLRRFDRPTVSDDHQVGIDQYRRGHACVPQREIPEGSSHFERAVVVPDESLCGDERSWNLVRYVERERRWLEEVRQEGACRLATPQGAVLLDVDLAPPRLSQARPKPPEYQGLSEMRKPP